MPSDKSKRHTHFSSTKVELPLEFYFSIGRALYRWTQVEGIVCSLATSLLNIPWLDAVQRLRGGTGFKVKNIFEQLQAEVTKRGGDPKVTATLERARKLYEARKVLFHSMWGELIGKDSRVVGIQEWSSTSYDNFREVSLSELSEFADECLDVGQGLLREAIPFFHDAGAFVVNDDGTTEGYSGRAKT